jgi:large subunit ribosomal protein L4
MAVVNVYNLQRVKIAEMELKDEVFGVPAKPHVLHQVVVGQLNGRRLGTASTKGRSDVSMSGKKLWRQKGTGRARVGDASSPTRRGGGVAFGPKPHGYATKVPKKVRKAALRMALSEKMQSDRLIVLSDLALPDMKTKGFVGVMKGFDVEKALIVTHGKNENLDKSSRNVPWVKVMEYQGLNVYDLLTHDHLVMEQAAIESVQEALIS